MHKAHATRIVAEKEVISFTEGMLPIQYLVVTLYLFHFI